MDPRHAGKVCKASGKLRWLSQVDAAIAKADLGNDGDVYRCRVCGYWHVTRPPARN